MGSARMQATVLAAALVVWYVALRASWRAADALAGSSSSHTAGVYAGTPYVDSLVECALVPRLNVERRQFEGGAEPPFAHDVARATARRGRAATRARPEPSPLYLNGILLRSSKPQAILEDAQGRTSIVGVGDSIGPNRVVRIKPDHVVLRAGGRTYSVQVRE